MPIYSYVCEDCKAKFDLLVGVTSHDDEKVCNKCGSKNIKRALTTFAVRKSGLGSSSGESCPTGVCPTCY